MIAVRQCAPVQPGHARGCVMFADMLGGTLADGAGVVGAARQPHQVFGQHFFFGMTRIHTHAGRFGEARGLLARAHQHRLAQAHQPNRDPRGFARHRVAQVDASIHGRGAQPEVALVEIADTHDPGVVARACGSTARARSDETKSPATSSMMSAERRARWKARSSASKRLDSRKCPKTPTRKVCDAIPSPARHRITSERDGRSGGQREQMRDFVDRRAAHVLVDQGRCARVMNNHRPRPLRYPLDHRIAEVFRVGGRTRAPAPQFARQVFAPVTIVIDELGDDIRARSRRPGRNDAAPRRAAPPRRAS